MLMQMFKMTMEKDKAELENKTDKFFSDLAKVQSVMKDGPYFRSQFSLVDTSWAPIFMRLFLTPKIKENKRWSEIPKVRNWGEELMKVPAVKESVIPDFAEQYVSYGRERGSLLF